MASFRDSAVAWWPLSSGSGWLDSTLLPILCLPFSLLLSSPLIKSHVLISCYLSQVYQVYHFWCHVLLPPHGTSHNSPFWATLGNKGKLNANHASSDSR